MLRHLPHRILIAALLVLGTLAGAGAASAFWSGAGEGSQDASTGRSSAVTLSPATPVAGLYPGGAADVVLTVSNPNSFTVRVTMLALDSTRGTGGFGVDAGHAGCSTTALSFTSQTNAGAGWTVPAAADSVDGTVLLTLPDSLAMRLDAANACQGATITVFLTTTA